MTYHVQILLLVRQPLFDRAALLLTQTSWVLPPLSVGKTTLRLYGALNYSHGLSKGPSFGTGRGLINPLFRALQWDFTDFDSIKSEPRVPEFNEPVDYAFYSSKKKSAKPILLLEAKRLGSNIGHKNHVKQLTSYLGAMGVQWGVALQSSNGHRFRLAQSAAFTCALSKFDDWRLALTNTALLAEQESSIAPGM